MLTIHIIINHGQTMSRITTLLTSAVLCALIPSLLPAQSSHTAPVFSTFFGGSGAENLRGITSDDMGNVYVTGGTSSTDFPTTPGAYDRTFATGGSSLGSGGPMDAFVAKYSPAGQLLWSTLLGGPNYDRAYAIEVDRDGYVYVGGRAGDEFPTTTGALQEEFAGDSSPNGLYGKQDAFVAKLSPGGDSLIWATYFGADDLGFARDIDIDGAGNVYLAFSGATRPNPHITAGAFQTTPGGAEDMIVAKISGDGERVVWATYYGGSKYDGGGPAIRVHTDGTVIVVGGTASTDLPRAGAGADVPYGGGNRDLYVARFSADGRTLLWGRYFGGSGNDDTETHSLAIDDRSNAYVAAYTTSADLPVTPGISSSLQGNGDIPVAKFAAADGELLACRYLGGSGEEDGQGIAISKSGHVVIGGGTLSSDFPITAQAFQDSSTGGSDMIIAILKPDLSEIVWSSRFGGSKDDHGRTLWADRAGNVYLAGHSASRDLPLYEAAQEGFGGGSDDGAVTRFCPPFSQDSRELLYISPACWSTGEQNPDAFISLVLNQPRDTTIVVSLHVGGSASSGEDHTMVDTVITISPGESFVFFRPRILDDEVPEGIENLEVTAQVLSGPGYFDGRNVARIWIHDNDSPTRNLLVQPGFESEGEVPGWQKTTNGGRSIGTAQTHSGERGLRMEGSSQYNREVYQNVPVTSGAEYICSGYILNNGISAYGTIGEIVWLNESGEAIGVQSLAYTPTLQSPPSWSFFSGCTTPPDGAATARFRLYIDVQPSGAGEMWFDDLGFYRADGTTGVEGEFEGVPSRTDLR